VESVEKTIEIDRTYLETIKDISNNQKNSYSYKKFKMSKT
jgi:hypothetical protein